MNKIIGAKSGSGKQRKPVIAPDSLQSKVYINMLYGLSEGEIAGLATGDEQSIYLDDTPLKNASGEWNFQNVTVDFRHGTNDQTYIEGFPDVASEVAVNVELRHGTPWVKSFNNLDLDAVRVRLKWGALKQQNAENGDVNGVRIQYAIDLKIDNLAWQEVLNTEINAKTSTNYERSHRIDLPTAQRGWQIRVRRITPNSTSEYVSDKMYISAVTEVVDLKLRYPNTALLGLQYDAEHFSNVAKMAVRLKGLKIKVPSNYDPETRQYHGFWDGTFKREYSNNPAWIYYDICTADRYGLGERLKPFMVDKWSLYRLAQYCDEMVSDGNGGLEPRFTLNVYLQSADDAFAILSKMSGVFRAISYWNGQQIICDADMPQDSMYSFSRANVIDGQFEYTGTRARDRHTVAKVAWDNKNNRFKTEYEFVRDEQAISKLGIKFVDIQAWGCTSKGQAQRAGWWALKSEQLETRMVSFKVGLDGYIPQPGKVIEISDELFAGRANGGRVSAINTSKNIISLDRAITAKAGDKLIINGENGRAETRIIQTVQNHQVTVTQPFDNIAVENVWVLDSKDLATMKFRVLSITQDEKHQFKITAVQYTPSKYDAIDTGAYIDERPISVINPKIQAPVTEVNIETEYRTVQGLNVATMIISYPQVSGAVKYQVEWRKDNGNWIKLPITGANSVEVVGVYAGQYEARVTAISAFDVHSLATHSTLTAVQGKAGKPPKLARLTATGTLFGMRLDWAFSAKSEDTAYTEIQVSPDGRSNIATLGQFAYPTDTHQIQGLQGNLTQFYRAKIVDRLGNESDWTDWTSGTTSADPQAVLEILEGQINESTLDNILTGKINTAVTTGTANTQAILAEQQARTQAVTAEAQARATAISNEAKARTAEINQRVTALNSEIGTTLAGLQNGLTQEIQQRKDGYNSTLANLNAYKVSNDRAVANVIERVNVSVSDMSSNASKINALQSELNNVNNTLASKASTTALNALTTCVTQQGSNITAISNDVRNLQSSISTVQNGLANKLDASVISNYYTKIETDNAISGKVEEFNANLTVGGVNILPNSHVERTGKNEHLYYAILPELKEFYLNNPVVTISFDIKVPVVGRVQVYSTNNSGVYFVANINVTEINVFKRYSVTVTPKPHTNSPNNPNGTLEFWGVYGTGRIPTVKNVKIESGNKATDWTPALSDVDGKINANAQAINTINSNVSNLNNTLTSQSQQLTQLRNDLTLTNANVATKADTTALNTLDSRVTQTNDRITAESQKITALQNSLDTVSGTLNSKADSSALSNLNTTVQNINGAVTTQANQITQLESGLNTVNQTLNNKVNASALSDYYTKTETDNAVSGKIDEFKTSLVIGGENILTLDKAVFSSSDISRKELINAYDEHYRITLNRRAFPFNSEFRLAQDLDLQGEYVFSCQIRASKALMVHRIFLRDINWAYSYAKTNIAVNEQWQTIEFTQNINTRIIHFGVRLENNTIWNADDWFEIRYVQLQRGTKATAFHKASAIVQNSINANAQAINTINSNVSNLNNIVTSQGQAITQLNNNLTAINTNVSQKADSTALTALDNKVTQQGNNITSQANQITALQSGLNTANQNIATKLDSSAIVNYYTKAETDNVIGGKVEQFKATLDNTSLLPDPNMSDVNSWWSHYNYDFSQYLKTVTDGKVAPTVFRKDTRHSACWNYNRTSVPNIRKYKLSAWVRRSSNSAGAMYFTYRFLKAEDNQIVQSQYGNFGNITAKVPADESWHLVSLTVDLTHRTDIAKIFFGFAIGHAQVGGWWELQGFRCESVLSSNDMDNTVATATALQQTNTNVSNLNSQLTTQAKQITTLTTQQNSQSTTISQQTQTINGISAVRAVTVDNNGVISGYGLMSELRNGRVTSQFGVNADTFYIGSPSNGKKPFIFNASPRVIDGVSYPAGAWINSAYIANATIKNAHIQDSTLETAKIKDGAITNAKIANASIDNAKIKNGSIQTAHIQDLAVGEIKIAHGSVTVGSLVSGKINAVPSFTILEVANKKILMLLKIKAKITIDNRFSSSNLRYNPAFIIKRNGKEIKRYNAYMKQVGLKGGYQRWEGGDGGFVISSVEYACEFDINEYLCDLNLTGRQIYSFEFLDDTDNGKWDGKSTNFINSSSVEVVFLELKK
ncbi:phage tail protein [Moraxella sp. ZY210820]|uniref:TipJ family phage tail tip protein n=1 Tax=unclassified Moraxella TaxID=2685852 RepID=UPI0027306171|nr:phage tail protein [Moraxella sp. ZY210820]WLF83810.1 phage tail protein [Moraxella sp. ZY210820]